MVQCQVVDLARPPGRHRHGMIHRWTTPLVCTLYLSPAPTNRSGKVALPLTGSLRLRPEADKLRAMA